MKLSIRSKILLGYAVVLVLFFISQTFGFKLTEKYIRNQNNQILKEKARDAASYINNLTSSIELDHLGIGREFQLNYESDPDKVVEVIKYSIRQKFFYQNISILSPTGRELIKADRYSVSRDENLSIEIPTDPFKSALSGRTAVSKVYFSESDSMPYLSVFTPVVSELGLVAGVVKSQLRLDRLSDVIAQVKLGKSGFAYVVDDEGRLIMHPKHELVLSGPNFSDRPVIKRQLDSGEDNEQLLPESSDVYTNEDNVRVVSDSLKIPGLEWIVVVEQPEAEIFAQLTMLRNLYFTTAAFSLLLLVASSIVLSTRFIQPILKLIYFTDLIKQGNLDTEVEITSGDEIEDLGKSLNIMALQLKTNRSQLEREKENISSERNKLAVILSAIEDGVIATDLNQCITQFNSAAEKITGTESKQVIGRYLKEVFRLYDKEEELLPDRYAPIRNDTFEGVIFNKKNLRLVANQKESCVNLVTGKITESRAGNLGCIITVHDVTEELKLEEMKVDFVSMAAHELRTPLTSIRGYVQIISDEIAPQLSDEHKRYVERLVVSTRNLNSLIDNLLNVARIERDAFKVDVSPVDLSETISNTVSGFKEIAHTKNQTVEYLPLTTKFPHVLADSFRISQVLSNLLSNAVAYTQSGGTIKVKESIESNPDINGKSRLVVSIMDTGQGIPKEAIPKLFSKFYRVSGALEQGSKGTGLGLFISKSIIEMHHGNIWVRSELGKGSTFYFALPILTDDSIKHFNEIKTGDKLSQVNMNGILLK
ncbi:MAG: multi-sensor signal transduction histidine kinase, two-component system, OmpR family, sensor histidine kinase VicK [Candidatus Gottesmanbacteria bacterium GW2011_GWA2_43_14]|uniref:histidine kinase n=1 Tax=Candidatus Gottesmanbacteria bacterium GW2011_GWA2_43_14 TaxID=1618443 RepID=A0A0G1DKI9_9BACT|nr:MAG: multi-sensor signal transduction histidine kinase, two-component system, OmpR family, sensor histidine kinase VicK [Candidatus Gottesmanbacteria bacterium GW2011_GWA2_43_14]